MRGVLHILQGFSSSLFCWDNVRERFRVKSGIYVTHLSHGSLHVLLNQFTYAASCLKQVEVIIGWVDSSGRINSPTVRAFSCAVSAWLKVIMLLDVSWLALCLVISNVISAYSISGSLEQKLRDIALKEEMKISESMGRITPTLLGLANSLTGSVSITLKLIYFKTENVLTTILLSHAINHFIAY